MLAGGADGAYRSILAGGGRFVHRLEAWKSGVRVDTYGDTPDEFGNSGIPFTDGKLSANLANRVTRKLNLSVPLALFPKNDGDLLDPLATELVLWCGWRAGAQPTYLWKVFTGPITTVSKNTSSRATFTLDAADRVEQIVEDKFTTPVQSGAGVLVTTRVKDLISDSQPGAEFGQFDETYAVTPKLTWESDRAQAIDDLASGVGCYWYQLPDGSYTMRIIPWSQNSLGSPVTTLTQGVDLTQVTTTRSRIGVYTVCEVTGEPTDGTTPVSGTIQDTDQTSPTYFGGPLGRRVLKVQEDSVSSVAQAQSLARQLLRRAKVRITQVSTIGPFDPSLELGDAVTIATEDGAFTQALASFSADLGGAANMSAQWRSPGGASND